MASYTRVYTFDGITKATLTVTVNTTSTSVANNTSTEQVKVVFHNPGSASFGTLTGSLSYNGDDINFSKSYSAGITITLLDKSYTTTHNSDGKKTVSFVVNANGNNEGLIEGLSKTDTFVLDTIPRYTTISTFTLTNATFNSVRVNWGTADNINRVQYQIGEGDWVDGETSINKKSGNFTIGGLSPSITYSIKIRVRRADSGLETTSSAKSVTTENGLTTISAFTITNITFVSAQVNWSTTDTVDRVQYKVGSGTWTNGYNNSTGAKSGNFIVGGLEPDKTYSINIKVRRKDSQLETTGTAKSVSTKKIAKFVSVPDNIDISKPFTVNFNRNDATTVEVGVYDTSGSGTFALYRVATGTSYTFNLTTTEKNRFYDDMPTVQSKQYLVFIATNSNTYRQAVNRTFKIINAFPSTPAFTQKDNFSATKTLTGNDQKFIQNYSELSITLSTTTPFRGSTITKYTVINGSKTKDYTSSGTKTDFGKIVAQQLQVIVTDSRGFTSQLIRQLNYIPYTQPTIQNFLLNREIGVSTNTDFITNGLYTNVNFGAVANKIKKVEYRKKTTGDYGGWTDITAKVVYGSGTFNNAPNQQVGGFTFGTLYTVEMRVYDEITFSVRTTTVSKGLFTALIDPLYGSVGFGEMPPEENNAIAIKGNAYANNLQEIVLWSSSSGVLLGTTTLTGMPNLTNYMNWKLDLYLAYGNDIIKVETFLINRTTNLFLYYLRDLDGANSFLVFGYVLKNLNTTSWDVQEVTQKSISKSNALSDRTYNNTRLYKVVVRK